MLRSIKAARFGRAALAIAGFLAVMGSFGLHPEPAQPQTLAAAGSLPAWSVSQNVERTSHDCLACLAHRFVSLTRLSGVILQPGSSVQAALLPRAIFPRRPSRSHDEGRAPPTLG